MPEESIGYCDVQPVALNVRLKGTRSIHAGKGHTQDSCPMGVEAVVALGGKFAAGQL